MLKAGDAAPDFTLPDEQDRPVSLRELRAAGPVVVFFYPRDFTPVCTREACMMRDAHAELAAAGITVVGISADSVASHERFRDKHSLPYTLLADVDKRTIKAYGVDGPLGFGVRRATFLVGADGIVRDAVNAALRVGAHEALLRRALADAAAHTR
jgi:peroxiredoxin Q/BCP